MNKKNQIEMINKKEVIRSAFELSLNCFYPEYVPENAKLVWENKWFHEPYINKSNVYIMRSNHQRILGGLKIVRRKIFRFDAHVATSNYSCLYLVYYWLS